MILEYVLAVLMVCCTWYPIDRRKSGENTKMERSDEVDSTRAGGGLEKPSPSSSLCPDRFEGYGELMVKVIARRCGMWFSQDHVIL